MPELLNPLTALPTVAAWFHAFAKMSSDSTLSGPFPPFLQTYVLQALLLNTFSGLKKATSRGWSFRGLCGGKHKWCLLVPSPVLKDQSNVINDH
jgi:hypothetical protein